MTPNPNPTPELQRARELLAQAYERADLICPAADVRSGNKIDWVREKVALDAILAALSQTLPAPGEEWTRTQAFGEAAVECLRAAEESKFADTVSEDERKGYRTACTLMSMSFRVMASRAAPDWPLATVAAANDQGVARIEFIARVLWADGQRRLKQGQSDLPRTRTDFRDAARALLDHPALATSRSQHEGASS